MPDPPPPTPIIMGDYLLAVGSTSGDPAYQPIVVTGTSSAPAVLIGAGVVDTRLGVDDHTFDGGTFLAGTFDGGAADIFD